MFNAIANKTGLAPGVSLMRLKRHVQSSGEHRDSHPAATETGTETDTETKTQRDEAYSTRRLLCTSTGAGAEVNVATDDTSQAAPPAKGEDAGVLAVSAETPLSPEGTTNLRNLVNEVRV